MNMASGPRLREQGVVHLERVESPLRFISSCSCPSWPTIGVTACAPASACAVSCVISSEAPETAASPSACANDIGDRACSPPGSR